MKYLPGLLAGQLSGSSGNTTASRNRFSSYFRTRVMPADPATSLQTVQRSILGASSTAWRGLTSAQRAGWVTLGGQLTRTNSLGAVYTLTGQQAFSSYYRNALTLGIAPLTTAPALSAPNALTSFSATATAA